MLGRDSDVYRTYDAAGRLLTSRRAGEYPSYDWDGQPATWYEVFAYDSLAGFDFGRSNGRPVWSLRANHALTNAGTNDLGWFGVTSYFHYNGLGGRLGFRQQSDLLMPEPALPAPQLLATLGTKSSPLADTLRVYFEKQGRKAKSRKDLLAASASESASLAALLGDPWEPSGPARWSYAWDTAGRLQSITYPRRDEGFPAQVSYSYDSGFLSSVNATFRDPFASGTVGTVSASLSYDASGRVRETGVTTSSVSGDAFRLFTERDASGLSRPASWVFHRRSGSGTTLHEQRDYAWDPSGNVASISSSAGFPASYLYDSRGRLLRDQLTGRPFNPESREYDGFGNLVKVTGSGTTLIPTSLTTNRLSSSLASWDAAGRMTEDASRLLGRDYYPDGALLAEFRHARGSTETLFPYGISVWLLDGKAENALSFWGDGVLCPSDQFRSLVRDEGARLLTEYRAEALDPSCTCETVCEWRDRFSSDVVRLGPWATASYTRGTGIRLEARDHLGSPRVVTDAAGAVTSTVLLDSFGLEITGTPATRERFTGHERNHRSGDGFCTVPKAMRSGRLASPWSSCTLEVWGVKGGPEAISRAGKVVPHGSRIQPRRRHPEMHRSADDLRRFLDGHPIVARSHT